jgi:hypothetical protein
VEEDLADRTVDDDHQALSQRRAIVIALGGQAVGKPIFEARLVRTGDQDGRVPGRIGKPVARTKGCAAQRKSIRLALIQAVAVLAAGVPRNS